MHKQHWAVVAHRPAPQQFRKLRQEDCKFKASLGSFVYPCLKLEKNQKGRQCSSVVEYLLSSSASMRRALSLISGTGKKQDKTTKTENKTKQNKSPRAQQAGG